MPLLNRCGGGSAELQSKTVTPKTTKQTIKPDSGYDGLSQVVVNAMDTVTLQSKSVSPSTSSQTVTPDSGYDGLSQVTVGAIKLQTPNAVTPSTSSQTISPTGSYDGLAKVVVNGDSDLKASNIKSGVSIFGVTGSYKSTPRTVKLSNAPMSWYEGANGYVLRCTINTTNLIGFFFGVNKSVSDNDSGGTIIGGYIDLINNTASIIHTSGSTTSDVTAFYTTSASFTVDSSYVTLDNVGFWGHADTSNLFWVVATYSE